ncbi:MAG: hypothetical protein GX624_11145 [Actinobacteria bacterium]|nr:hypothetical protein [Actinomycetota bacterium]
MHRQLALIIALCLVAVSAVAGLASARPATLQDVVERTVTAGPRGTHDLVRAGQTVLDAADGVSATIRTTAYQGFCWNVEKSVDVSTVFTGAFRPDAPAATIAEVPSSTTPVPAAEPAKPATQSATPESIVTLTPAPTAAASTTVYAAAQATARAATAPALTGTASAETAASSHPASHMNDSSTSTYWQASSSAVPQKVTIDLGSPKAVSASNVSWRVNGAVHFRVFGSNDQRAWRELANCDGNRLATTSTAISGTWRYVRMRIGYVASGSAGIYDWKVYGTATASPSPTATPKPTATPTQTATPKPTATPTSGSSASYTTMTNAKLQSGTSSAPRVYENIIFKGGSSTTGVLHINYNLHDVVLRNCIIDTGPQNGWTINTNDSVSVYNIRVEGLTIRPQPRMGLEFTDRTYSGRSTNNWRYLTLNNVTVEPSGSEAVSFCSTAMGNAYTTVKDMVIEGSGTRPDLYSWGQGFEINKAKGITVDGLTIRQTRGSAFNLQGPSSSTNMMWKFTRVNADMSVRDSQQTQSMSTTSQVVYCKNATGWSFSGRVVATVSDCGYLDNVKGATFTGTSWTRVGGTARVLQANGSSGNIGLP